MAIRRRALVAIDARSIVRRRHRASHRVIWLALAGLLPGIVLLSLALRPNGPTEAPQTQLAAPR